MTRRRFQARERAALDSERSGFASSRMSGDSDKTTTGRRDDLAIGESLDDLDRDVTALESRVQPVAHLHIALSAGVVTEFARAGLEAVMVGANVEVTLDDPLLSYSVQVFNQADTTDTYRRAVSTSAGFEVSSYDVLGVSRDLSVVDAEFAVWVWRLTP